ncbi:MAG TPA: LacI family DNA-binding transcriptional regulator [Ignavibacteriaceae bacterium]|nr:LacI family DNA-binding transcriptional regulator [Ignavibacteriaceae bacterium]
MTTILDVAKKAKVSVVTVSRLLNNPDIVSSRTANKIFQVMEQLNYQPSQAARYLVQKKTNTIAVIMPDIKNTFFNSWFRFIEEYSSERDFNLVLCNTDEDPLKEIKYVKLIHSQRVDGAIIAPTSKASVEYLIKSKVRFILFDRVFKDLNTNFISTDHYKGSYDATEYLIRLGHKKIAILKGNGTLYPDVERFAGFRNAMKKYNIKIDPDLIMNCEFNEDKALSATKLLLQRSDKPTVIFPFNGLMSIGVIKAVQQLKLSIPEDISILSFDEIPGSDIFRPEITHVMQPVNTLGKDIMAAMIRMISNSSQHVRVFQNPELIIGNSVKKI